MAHPMGESKAGVLRLDFDRRLKLGFHGSKVTSDAGLLPYRELDDAVGLSEVAGDVLTDTRRGKNGRHGLVGQFRQSVFGRLGGVRRRERCRAPNRLPRAVRWGASRRRLWPARKTGPRLPVFPNASPAEGSGKLVADDATREAGEDRCQGRPSRAVRHVPIGRGSRAEEPVSGNPAADRRIAAKPRSGVGRGNSRQGTKRWERCVWMMKNRAEWAFEHAQITKICLSDLCRRKTLPVVVGFGYHRRGFEGYLGNVGSNGQAPAGYAA